VDCGGAAVSDPGDERGGEDTVAAGGRSFGANLHELRIRRQLTQEELADRAGLSVRTLRYLESGRTGQPRRYTVRRLADGLELAPAERRDG
jgi:DNA-binding XRE family transcriptional regulator